HKTSDSRSEPLPKQVTKGLYFEKIFFILLNRADVNKKNNCCTTVRNDTRGCPCRHIKHRMTGKKWYSIPINNMVYFLDLDIWIKACHGWIYRGALC
ncbi:MAG: hypothetical protein WBV91_08030, partial [Desulfobacterales bacterium]